MVSGHFCFEVILKFTQTKVKFVCWIKETK